MPLANYTELQEAIASWVVRSDLADVIPTFIMLAEARLFNEVRIREMIREQAGNIAAEIDLPADFQQVDLLKIDTNPISTPPMISSAEGYRVYGSTPGMPLYYAIEGLTLLLFPPPSGSFTYTLSYYASVPPLSDESGEETNAVFAKIPHLYLFASLIEAYAFLQEEERAGTWAVKFESAKAAVHAAERRARFHQGAISARVA